MEKSESIKDLATALAAFQKEVAGVTKDGKNPHFNSKFATLDNVIATIKQPMAKNGLSYSQLPDGAGLTTILMHKSGEWISATATMMFDKATAQGAGSAYTYWRRYGLLAITGLAGDEDDDGNEASRPKSRYDTTPVPDDAEAVSSEDDDFAEATTPKPKAKAPAKKTTGYVSFTEKKRIIKDLVDSLALTDLTEKEEYEAYVKENTGLDLTAPNYDAIIKRLEVLAG